jgi:uncharacterized protein with HEPN domain
MRRSPKLYLADIQMHGGRALDYIAGLSLTRYSSSQKTKDAVERNLFIVGEAVTQLRNSYPDVAEQLRGAPDIVAFRNVLRMATQWSMTLLFGRYYRTGCRNCLLMLSILRRR